MCTSVWFVFDARCYWKLSKRRTCWRTTKAGARVTFHLKDVTELSISGERMSSIAVDKNGVAAKKSDLDDVFSTILSAVPPYSNVVTLVFLPRTRFQLLPMELLPVLLRDPAIYGGSIGYWFENFVINCFLQTLSVNPFSSSSSTNRWCQKNYDLISAFLLSTRYKQFFISSSFEKKELLEFTMSKHFQLKVTTGNKLFFSMYMSWSNNVFFYLFSIFNFLKLKDNHFT